MAIFNKEKRLNKLNAEQDTTESEVDIFLHDQEKARKKIKRKDTRRKIVTYLLVGLGILGGFRGLVSTPEQVMVGGYARDTTMIENYIDAYFTYPQTPEINEFMSEFALISTDRLSFEQSIQSAKVKDVSIYSAQRISNTITRYYLSVEVELSPSTGGDSIKENFDCALDLLVENDTYKVVSPLSFITNDLSAFKEVEVLEKYKPQSHKAGTPVSDTEKSDIEQSVRLFYKTYNSDYEQSLLLISGMELAPLNEGTQINVSSISGISLSGSEYVINANIDVITNESIKVTRNVEILLNKETNKITSIKEMNL